MELHGDVPVKALQSTSTVQLPPVPGVAAHGGIADANVLL